MKKIVLKVDMHDEKSKQKAMRAVSSLPGIDSISMDMKEAKMTVTGNVDPVEIVRKLRKQWHAHILTVGAAKEEKKDGGSGAGKKEDEEAEKKKKKEQSEAAALLRAYHERNTCLAKYYHSPVVIYEDQFPGCVIS